MQIMRDILTIASRAPSGSNSALKRLCDYGQEIRWNAAAWFAKPKLNLYNNPNWVSSIKKPLPWWFKTWWSLPRRVLWIPVQAACNHFHSIVLDVLNAPEDEELVCTLALDYADPDDIVNTFIPPRIAVDEFTVFMD